MNELVSIIMPSYNTGEFISDSIQSVIDQTYTNWELLIVDDCSTDNTIEIVKSFNDPRIHLYQNLKNLGAAYSRNYALRVAEGKWIAFLDSDDLWLPSKLSSQIEFMTKHNYSFSYTDYYEIESFGERTVSHVTGPKRITQKGFYNYCWPGCLTVMYDSSITGLVQVPNIKKNNDYAMWLIVSKKIPDCYLLEEPLALYRRGRAGSISNVKVFELIKYHYILFREVEDKGVLFSLINTLRNIVFGLYKKVNYVKVI